MRGIFLNQWYFGTYIIGKNELVSVMYRVEYFFGTCLKSWVQGFVTYMDLFTFSQFICILLYTSWCEFGHLFLFATDKIYVTCYRYNFEQYATNIEKLLFMWVLLSQTTANMFEFASCFDIGELWNVAALQYHPKSLLVLIYNGHLVFARFLEIHQSN